MKFIYSIESPCKINLSLEVHKKRPDGYHDLTSIFQMVSLSDRISVVRNDTSDIDIVGDFDCKPEENLIYKATNKFKDIATIEDGFNIFVDKRVPAGGGIGGGSSNCAAILLLLNTMYNNILTAEDLFGIAISLGSDVPFFLGSGTALVEGRGEIITKLDTITDYYIVLVNPQVHVSTAEAFRKLNDKKIQTDKNSKYRENMVANYQKGIKNFSKFKNSFEIALQSDYNFIEAIKDTLNESGSIFSSLSGSGSTVYGIFKSIKSAETAKKNISKNSSYNAYIVEPINEFPNVEIKEIL